MLQFIIFTVRPLCSGLNNEGGRQGEGAYRDPVLHFHASRLIALCGGDRNEKPPQQRMRERNSYALRLRTCTLPVQLLAAGEPLSAHSQPALRIGLMPPLSILPGGLSPYFYVRETATLHLPQS